MEKNPTKKRRILIKKKKRDSSGFTVYSNKNILIFLLIESEEIKNVFDSVVASTFQITFRAKMHANDVFSFFKNYF